MSASASSANQIERVRKFLNGLSGDDFNAFGLDRFSDVCTKLTGSMTKTPCINLWLEAVEQGVVLQQLCRRFAKIREQIQSESEQSVWSALTGLDRVKQWQELIGRIQARPRMNRLVAVQAKTDQHLALIVERMELYLRRAGSGTLIKVPVSHRGHTALTGLGWENRLKVQLNQLNNGTSTEVAKPLRIETQRQPVVLTLLFADVPRHLLRDVHEKWEPGLREFLLTMLPTLLSGLSRVTVVVPIEHAKTRNMLMDPLESAEVKKLWNQPLKQRELVILPELSFPDWTEVDCTLESVRSRSSPASYATNQ